MLKPLAVLPIAALLTGCCTTEYTPVQATMCVEYGEQYEHLGITYIPCKKFSHSITYIPSCK